MLMQIVILFAQIRVNSMAVVGMKSNDYESSDQIGKVVAMGSGLTSTVEQVCAYVTTSFLSLSSVLFFYFSSSYECQNF